MDDKGAEEEEDTELQRGHGNSHREGRLPAGFREGKPAKGKSTAVEGQRGLDLSWAEHSWLQVQWTIRRVCTGTRAGSWPRGPLAT